MEFLEFVFVAIIVYYGSKALWVSTLIIEKRKKNYRAGTHDYYGNKIEKDENNGWHSGPTCYYIEVIERETND